MPPEPRANAGQTTGVRISTDAADVDLDWLHPALSERAYWALGRSREDVETVIECHAHRLVALLVEDSTEPERLSAIRRHVSLLFVI